MLPTSIRSKSAVAIATIFEFCANGGHFVVYELGQNSHCSSTSINNHTFQCGTLKDGDIIIAGTSYGKVKKMTNDKGVEILEATPSVPVEIQELNEVPHAGDKFNVVQTEKQAKDTVEYRARVAKEKKISIAPRSSSEELFLKASGISKIKELPLIIKCDVHGSVEAIASSLLKLPNDEVKLRNRHSGVGPITESDISLAHASSAIIIGFNVRAGVNAVTAAEKEKVEIRYYRIIYDLIDDVKAIISGMLDPIIREQYIGTLEIRQVFNITKTGKIAGSYVIRGIIKKGAGVRLLRDNILIHESKLKTLKRFKDEVKEVREGYECGIAFENYEDIRENDIVEVFELIQEKKTIIVLLDMDRKMPPVIPWLGNYSFPFIFIFSNIILKGQSPFFFGFWMIQCFFDR